MGSDLIFKTAIMNNVSVMLRLQLRVFLLQLLVLPSSPSVLKPDSNLPRIKPQLRGKLVFPLGLQFVLFPKALFKQIHLFFTKLSFPHNLTCFSFVLLSSPPLFRLP